MNPWTFCAGAPTFISSEATGLYLLPMKFQKNIRRIVSSMEGIIILNELLDIKEGQRYPICSVELPPKG